MTCEYLKDGFCRVCGKGDDPDAKCFLFEPTGIKSVINLSKVIIRKRPPINKLKPAKTHRELILRGMDINA